MKPAENKSIMIIAMENLAVLKIETRISGSRAELFSRKCCQYINEARNVAATRRIEMTNGLCQPWDTPSDRPISNKSKPEVKRKAPIQSTSEARGGFPAFFCLVGSLGITNIAVAATAKDVPAMTKKTTFQLVNSEIMPP